MQGERYECFWSLGSAETVDVTDFELNYNITNMERF